MPGDEAPLAYALRPATSLDHNVLYAINEAAMRGYVEAAYGPWVETVQREFFQARIDRGLLQAVVVGGEVVGLLEVDDRFDTVYVQEIAISPPSQGRGFGTAILRDIQQKAAARGAAVELQVLKVNPAKRLYERLGFLATGETETHHQMRWAAES